MDTSKNGNPVTVADRNRAEFTRRGVIGGAAAAITGLAGASVAAGVACASEAAADDAAIKPALGHIVHQSYICTGCRTCELSCSLFHERAINPQRARNIVNIDYQDAHRTNVLYCQQCDDPKCLKACPTGALHVDPDTGARVIDQDVCIGCQSCLNACIFAAGGQGQSRIKYNPETGTCFKCDLCGGDPMCVKRCPLGASMASWIEYGPIVRPGIDDYVELTTEGAIEGIEFTKEYSGAHAGKCEDEKEWALVETESGVAVKGQVTSSDGAELRVRMTAEFYDASGNLLGTSVEHQWCLTMHEHLEITLEYDCADYSDIASVKFVGNVGYWVSVSDVEY